MFRNTFLIFIITVSTKANDHLWLFNNGNNKQNNILFSSKTQHGNV